MTTVDAPSEYWCYSCDKRVLVETEEASQDDAVVCRECKNGFVESIPWAPPSPDPFFSGGDPSTSALGSQFLQMLRIFAQAARDEDAPSSPPPPPPPPAPDSRSEEDFLRIELEGWDNDEEDDDEDDDVEEEVDDVEDDVEGDEDDSEDQRRRRRDLFLTRMRDIAARSRGGGRNRILDWAEILMGAGDNSFEFRLELPDRFVGNREDYLDAAGFEALLQNLAESDGAAKRGAPPASRSAVEGLKIARVGVEEETVACAICKDGVGVGEEKTELPCGHGYHGECIVTWLGARNSCPVCRFELPTDDADYEEERRKRASSSSASGSS